MQLRDKAVLVKVTNAERLAWQRQAESAGVTVADLIRGRMDTQLVGRPPSLRRQRRRATAPAELVAQVARAGNNLNQIARRINAGQWGPGDRVAIMSALSTIERALCRMLETWTPGRDSHAD